MFRVTALSKIFQLSFAANFLGPTIEIDPVTKKANNIDNIFRYSPQNIK